MSDENQRIVVLNEENFGFPLGVVMNLFGEMLEPVNIKRRALVLCELIFKYQVVAEDSVQKELASSILAFFLPLYIRYLNRVKESYEASFKFRNLDRSIRNGAIAGRMLWEMLRLARFRPDALNQRVGRELVKRYMTKISQKRGAAFHCTDTTLKKIWKDYQCVSHLWAANILHYTNPQVWPIEKSELAKKIFPVGYSSLLFPHKKPLEFLANASEAFFTLAHNELMQTFFGKISKTKSKRMLHSRMRLKIEWEPELEERFEPEDLEFFLFDFNDDEQEIINNSLPPDKEERILRHS